MNWNFIGKLWFSTLLVFTLGCMLIGCSNQRWSPTDPMAGALDTDNMTIEATWEMDVDTNITP